MSRSALPLAALAALSLAACADDQKLVEQKIAFELDACKQAQGDTHEVRFETGKPYTMLRFACDAPISDIKITDQINGEGKVGPYEFKLRKNTGDNRWHLAQVRWPDLDDARNTLSFDNISQSDYQQADAALARAEAQAPHLAEIKERRLQIAITLRDNANKQAEPIPQRASLGPAKALFDKLIADTKSNNDTILEAKLRLQVLQYLDKQRRIAEDNSTPSESAAEWEAAAIKAVQNEADEAKAKGDTALHQKKLAEIEERKKEAADNVLKREEAAKTMTQLAAAFKAELCREIEPARALNPTDATLRGELSSTINAVQCP
jgi:hypothetical protein